MQVCPSCKGSQTVPGDVCPALSYCAEADTLLCILPDGSWDWSPHGSRQERLAYVGRQRARRGLDPAIMAEVARERHGITLCPRCGGHCALAQQATRDGRVQVRADCPVHGYVKFISQR
jgi:hypothetical protein